DLNLVLTAVVDGRRFLDVVRPAVHAHAHEAGPADLVEDCLVLLLAVPLDRRQQVQLRALRQGDDLVDDLVGRLRADRQAAGRAVGLTQPGVKDAQVVVDLGDGADCRARALAGGFLLDADGRRQAVDVLDLRLLELAEELAGVGRQRLDVAALALGVDRVQGQRTLARAARATADRHLLTRQGHVDVLQVVLLGTLDGQVRDAAGVRAFWLFPPRPTGCN